MYKNLRFDHEDDWRTASFGVFCPNVQLVRSRRLEWVDAKVSRLDAGSVEHGPIVRLGLKHLQVEKLS